ncbi:MAG: anthranilate phosphoribosyltransferase [Phycisphaeraceae bacterium]|nr:anthranilate phosphoribosyltransferase [Phycisphaeraceae bacterium]
MTPVQETLARLAQGALLGIEQTSDFFEEIFAGRADDAQIAAALSMMQVRGVTINELIGAARTMRRHATAVSTEGVGGVVIDTCGTGGAPKTFNVSTVAALVVAAAAPGKVSIAKHGNRSRSGRGSAELLMELGVNVDAPTEIQARCLREVGVCFCFAIHHHPAAKHAAAARRALAFPTIFNLLGPLCNPAGATRQLLGVYTRQAVEPMARALVALGSEKAWVVHGEDGLDEVSITGPTTVVQVHAGEVRVFDIRPEESGIDLRPMREIVADDLAAAVAMARDVLAGRPGTPSDMVALNAGAALHVAGAASDVREGVAMARDSMLSGAAARVLGGLAECSRAR